MQGYRCEPDAPVLQKIKVLDVITTANTGNHAMSKKIFLQMFEKSYSIIIRFLCFSFRFGFRLNDEVVSRSSPIRRWNLREEMPVPHT